MKMSIRQLNEKLSKLLEDQIEGDQTPHAQVEAIFNGEEEDTYLAEVIVPNLDEFTDAELLGIFNKISETGDGDYSIYPSQWDSEYGEYPARLALALSKSKDAENISEIYNVYYAGHDLSDEAIGIFKQAVKNDPNGTFKLFSSWAEYNGPTDISRFLNEMVGEQDDFILWCIKLIQQKNPELAKEVTENM